MISRTSQCSAHYEFVSYWHTSGATLHELWGKGRRWAVHTICCDVSRLHGSGEKCKFQCRLATKARFSTDDRRTRSAKRAAHLQRSPPRVHPAGHRARNNSTFKTSTSLSSLLGTKPFGSALAETPRGIVTTHASGRLNNSETNFRRDQSVSQSIRDFPRLRATYLLGLATPLRPPGTNRDGQAVETYRLERQLRWTEFRSTDSVVLVVRVSPSLESWRVREGRRWIAI